MKNDRTFTLNDDARAALRAALKAREETGWRSYREGKQQEKPAAPGQKPWGSWLMTKDDWCDVCDALEIDIESVLTRDASATARALTTNIETKMAERDASNPFVGKSAEDVAREALANVEGLIADRLFNGLLASVSTIAAEAVKAPPAPIVQTIVREVSGLDAKAVETSEKIGCVTAREAFGFRANEGGSKWAKALDGTELALYRCATSPLVDPDYVWRPDIAAKLAVACSRGFHVWLPGPAGTGKTTGAADFAGRLGRPFVRIAVNRTTEPRDLIGQKMPTVGGGTEWQDGPLTQAFRTPGCVLLIDEPTTLRSGSLEVFKTVLDTGKIYLETGEVVVMAPDVFIIAADNTEGQGDVTGNYIDTAPVNLAFLDRFAFRIRVDYLPAAKETELVAKRSGLSAEAVKHMVEYAGATRKEASGGSLTAPISTRRLLSWAGGVKDGLPSKDVFEDVVLTGANPSDLEKLRGLGVALNSSRHDEIDAIRDGRSLNAPSIPGLAPDLSEADARAASKFSTETLPS